MKTKSVLARIEKLFALLHEFVNMRRTYVVFKNYDSTTMVAYRKTFQSFNKRHRYKLFRHKTLGVSLIYLRDFKDFSDYYKCINGKNSAAYYSRKAGARGYKFVEIDRNSYVGDIYEINTSISERQGKQMEESYRKKTESFKDEQNFRYFGVLDSKNKLIAYCDLAFYGGFIQISRLLGHKNYLNDGIMYFMIVEIVKMVFDKYIMAGYEYIMYDTYFGASEGLRLFKTKLAFRPCRVKWIWE